METANNTAAYAKCTAAQIKMAEATSVIPIQLEEEKASDI